MHNASDAYLMHGISNGTTRFVLVLKNGNVGISSASPEQRLTVSGATDITHYNNSTINKIVQLQFNANAGHAPGAAGAGKPCIQRWFDGSTHNIVTAGIFDIREMVMETMVVD